MSYVLNAIINIVALGIITLCAAFFIVLNKYKNEMWGRIEFNETNNKGNDKRI